MGIDGRPPSSLALRHTRVDDDRDHERGYSRANGLVMIHLENATVSREAERRDFQADPDRFARTAAPGSKLVLSVIFPNLLRPRVDTPDGTSSPTRTNRETNAVPDAGKMSHRSYGYRRPSHRARAPRAHR